MKLVIIEDSALIRTQLIRILATQTRIHVEGFCGEEEAAVRMILDVQPDAVLLDLALSPGSGLSVLKRIREAKCASRVLVLSNSADEAIKQACQALGASGFYDKSQQAEDCLQQLYEWLPPLPDNEVVRLQVLQEVRLLCSPEEEAFDDIARLARDITGTPIALVSVVDQDRQWFLSRQGLDARETSRAASFCAHAIQSNELLEVPDALLDARFRDNPWVQGEPRLRFYAGVPLVMLSGEALGALCVLDVVPHRLSEQQRIGLKTLARSVVSEIELRRRMQRLEKEIERRTAAEALMTQLAMRDALTKLPNRAALMERMTQQLRLAARQGSRLAFLFVDLDRFKLINDTQGHDVGDSALLEVANRLRHALRDSDTVARLGGDEFAVLLPDVGSLEAAMVIAAQLNLALAEPAPLNGCRLRLDASIGVAVYPEHGSDVESLMRNADAAMYRAKQSGGGRACAASVLQHSRAQDSLLPLL